jgi:hypothetical protein
MAQAAAAATSGDAPRRPRSLSAETATVLTSIEAAMRASQMKRMDAAIAAGDLPDSGALPSKPARAANAPAGGGG